MPELRLNVLTNEWVIIAKERSSRPRDVLPERARSAVPEHVADCPFCPGNEALSEERWRLFDDKMGWRVRSVTNKYPALSMAVPEVRVERDGLRVRADGFGIHEVIIDSPRHDLSIAQMRAEQVRWLVQAYRHRYRELSADPRVCQLILFKNHGAAAGSSMTHPHSQLIATPVVSNQVRDRLRGMAEYLEQHGQCMVCKLIEDELADERHLVHVGPRFVAMVPYAALSRFHTWIFPRRHMARFGELGDDEVQDFAHTLHLVLAKMAQGLGEPDFNFVIRSAPSSCAPEQFHWYLSIVPRLNRTAGFELGSGMYVNGSLPEESAAFLRSVEPSLEP
ncbi:MAG: galactose-1-phosphate uridylyltransferase [Myxococcota bacterium]|jgi:UDPglucose--hexose-1-phosphate uridylyltransferase|nr:galactose-1-phosphate uridylyltransferase [Myxococcota bacterium]